MTIVRNVFRLKFGAMREARELWREGLAMLDAQGMGQVRLLADVVGPFYTLVLETGHASLGEWERSIGAAMGSAEWKAWYARFAPLVESGHREVFTVVQT